MTSQKLSISNISYKNDENVRELISETGHASQSNLRVLITESEDDI